MAFPDKWDAFELAQRVPLLDLLIQPRKAHVCLCEHEIKDELFAPANDALYNV